MVMMITASCQQVKSIDTTTESFQEAAKKQVKSKMKNGPRSDRAASLCRKVVVRINHNYYTITGAGTQENPEYGDMPYL